MFLKKNLISFLILQSLLSKLNSSVIHKRSSNPIPVCINGFTVRGDGITYCNKDASGILRVANEV